VEGAADPEPLRGKGELAERGGVHRTVGVHRGGDGNYRLGQANELGGAVEWPPVAPPVRPQPAGFE
jgi:hypothetical protein